jgi:TonB family protein
VPNAHLATSVAPHVVPSQPEPGAPEAPSPPIAPTAPTTPASPTADDPFLSWHTRSEQGPVFVDPLATAHQDALHAAAGNGSLAAESTGATGTADDGSTARSNARAIATAIRDDLQDAAPRQIAGSSPYYRALRQAAQRAWHPPETPAPSLAQTAVNTFITSQDVALDATRRSLGPLAGGPAAAAADSLDLAHPNSPLPQARNTMRARADATAITTRVTIDIDQDTSGHVVGSRVVRRSGVTAFDSVALDAVRHAAEQTPTPPEHVAGVWRSRWVFEAVASRDPLISALPSVDGAAAFGITGEATFDEVTGETELELPGRLHRRRRITIVSSHVVESSPRP